MAKAGLRLCVIRYCILNVFMHGLGDLFAVSNSFYHSLVINNSLTDVTTVNLPKEAEVYALTGKDGMRSTVMTLNGNDLVLGENDELPDLSGKAVPAVLWKSLPAAVHLLFSNSLLVHIAFPLTQKDRPKWTVLLYPGLSRILNDWLFQHP